ncbi:MAG TPA: YceI family protein, partial [Burkholderiaceae bacterium]|nr:YceI family protein [Burkholderiaceae bacterium]
MRPLAALCCIGAAALGALPAGRAASAAPIVYTLEPEHSFVQFEVLHFGTSTARGRFGPIAGQVTLDRDAHGGSARIAIDTAGVSTGLRVFDARIRRADLLASADFPQAVFNAESFRFDGDRLV